MLIYILSQSLSFSLALTYFRFMALAVLLPKPVLLKVASLPCFASLFLLLFWRWNIKSKSNYASDTLSDTVKNAILTQHGRLNLNS